MPFWLAFKVLEGTVYTNRGAKESSVLCSCEFCELQSRSAWQEKTTGTIVATMSRE